LVHIRAQDWHRSCNHIGDGEGRNGSVGKYNCPCIKIIEPSAKAEALERVKKLQDRFPVYPELDLKFLKEAFVE
jgi:hypothetical protein